MDERRQSARKRSFLQGRVYYNNRRASVDCLVRDISDTGAKLVFGETVVVPDALELYLPGREEMHRVFVQWRRGAEIGVDFGLPKTDKPAEAAPTDLSGRLAKLESELVALKRTVNELRAELRTSRGSGI